MNLSTVRRIYEPIEKAKFEELIRNPRVYKRTPKSIAKTTVDKIAKLIKENRSMPRDYILKVSGQSKTTTDAAIRIIFETGLIKKEKNLMLRGNPISYVWI